MIAHGKASTTALLVCLCWTALFTADAQSSPAIRPAGRLQLHKPIDRELGPGQADVFTVEVATGQFAYVVARQKGVDVIVSVVDPTGKTLLSADSPNSIFGPEPALWIASSSGTYSVKVAKSVRSTETGHYEVELTEMRQPTESDRKRIAAQSKLVTASTRERANDKAGRIAAIQLYQESATLARELRDQYGEALCRYRIGSVYHALGDQQKALSSFEQALALSRTLGDRSLEAAVLIGTGYVQYVLADRKKAQDDLQQALAIKQSVGDRSGEADAYWGMGFVSLAQGDRQKALDNFQQVLTLKRAVGDRPSEAAVLSNIGSVYVGMGDLPKAIDSFNQVLPVARATGDRSVEANALLNLAIANSRLGEQQKALETYQQTLPILRAIHDRNGEAGILSALGNIYSARGEFRKSLDNYRQALPLQHALGDHNAEASTLLNLGHVLRDLGAEGKALESYQQALSLGHTRSEVSAVMGMGDAYLSLGDRQKSLDSYQQSLTLQRAAGSHSGEALALIAIGNVYCNLSRKPQAPSSDPAQKKADDQKALEYFEKALDIGRASNDYSIQVFAMMGIGVSSSALGDKLKALDFLNQSLQLFSVAKSPQGQAWATYEVARVERDRINLEKARTLAGEARALVESLRPMVVNPDLRASFFAAANHCYELEIDILMSMHAADPSRNYQADAFAISERMRAKALLESLGEARAGIREGVDPLLLERERTLQAQLNAREMARMQMLGGPGAAELVPAMEKAIQDLGAQYEEVNTQIRARSPHYAALTLPQPLTLAEIQKEVLDPDTLLLEYALGNERSFLWTVSSTGITSVVLPGRGDVEKAARSFHDALADPKATGSLDAGTSLSRMLLGQVASGLGRKRLAIVAGGALQYLPFAALPDPANPKQPLIVNHEIVNLPSASTLAILRRENQDRKAAHKLLAVFADPVFTRDDSRLPRVQAKATASTSDADDSLGRSLSDLNLGTRLPRLSGTRREAAAIVSLVPENQRKEALDFDASRAALMSPDIGQYRILHLATYGLLDSTHPELSGVVLSMFDRQAKAEDGFLRLNDIYNLKLNADLVVLSACRTALGNEIQGEGLLGLTRGFMYAGVPRVMASLWKTDDHATAALLEHFYTNMFGRPSGSRSLPPAAALRQAQIEAWKSPGFEAPYYWAAFTLQGEWR